MPSLDYSSLLLYFLSGIAIITIIDSVGAILSRVLNFKYVYLIVVSVALYIFMGYLVAKNFNLSIALAINAVLGLYDGSAGLWLCLKLKANIDNREETGNMLNVKTAVTMMVIAVTLGLVGYSFIL
jgi:hypothetical protein